MQTIMRFTSRECQYGMERCVNSFSSSPSLRVFFFSLLFPFACFIQVLRRHGDVFERTAKGYYHAHGRADDTMNLGGIKVSI